jgi:hypothetical protein
MADATPFLPGLSAVSTKPLTAARDAGNLSSNGGLVVLREAARRLGLAAVTAGPLPTGATRSSSSTPVGRWCYARPPFILIMQPLALLSTHLMRSASPAATPLDLRTLAFVPAALFGAWFGLRIFERLSDRQFSIPVSILLILAGGALIL